MIKTIELTNKDLLITQLNRLNLKEEDEIGRFRTDSFLIIKFGNEKKQILIPFLILKETDDRITKIELYKNSAEPLNELRELLSK